jgi:hypothetical protein
MEEFSPVQEKARISFADAGFFHAIETYSLGGT